MPTTDTADYNNLFLTTAQDHLDAVTKLIDAAKNENLDASNAASEIFRHIHSLKGSASVMGYEEIVKLCDLIDAVVHTDANTFYMDASSLPKVENYLSAAQQSLDKLKGQSQ